jgi:hypothetical protein
VETAQISSVPTRGFRGLYSVGQDKKYAHVTVGYGLASEGVITPLEPREPHVYMTPSIARQELGQIDGAFPSVVSTRSGRTLARICRRGPNDELSCLRHVR